MSRISIVTRDPQLMALLKRIRAVAHSRQPVPISGDIGVGRKLCASRKREGAHVTVNTFLAPAGATEPEGVSVVFNGFPSIKQAQKLLISEALRIANGNQGAAASLLGVTRQALNNRLRRGMTPP